MAKYGDVLGDSCFRKARALVLFEYFDTPLNSEFLDLVKISVRISHENVVLNNIIQSLLRDTSGAEMEVLEVVDARRI